MKANDYAKNIRQGNIYKCLDGKLIKIIHVDEYHSVNVSGINANIIALKKADKNEAIHKKVVLYYSTFDITDEGILKHNDYSGNNIDLNNILIPEMWKD